MIDFCNRWLGAVLVLLVGAAGPTPTPPAPDNSFEISSELELTARQVQDGAYVITHAYPWPANALLVEMASGELVLVDTPYTPEAAQALLDWIAGEFGEREIVAINTGFHVDNLGGNSALIDAGIPVYGSNMIPELLEERGEETRAVLLDWLKSPRDRQYYDGHKVIPYVAPDHLFPLAEGLELQFGGELVQVYFPGETHAPDNVVVYFPDRKLMFGGCMILAGDTIGNTSDANMAAWPESIHRLESFEIDMLVPGHGDRLDPELIPHTLALLTETQAP
jgi:metallo-beta-lactamase class B